MNTNDVSRAPWAFDLDTATRRADWAVVAVEGDDAAQFLHSQLTHDTLLLPDGGARWTALCSAKGRVIASMVLVKHSAKRFELVVMTDLAEALIKRLRMFVLRAKATLTLQPERAVWCVALPEPKLPVWTSQAFSANQIAVALLPASGFGRALILGPSQAAPPTDAPKLGAAQQDDLRSGWAWIGAAQSDQHVPQMLNYESIDGVSFKKGCYPGQEVVARSQFRGAIKRRCWPAQTSRRSEPGDEVFADESGNDAIGVVVQGADTQALIVVQHQAALDALEVRGGLCWSGPPQRRATLTLRAIPYPLRDDL